MLWPSGSEVHKPVPYRMECAERNLITKTNRLHAVILRVAAITTIPFSIQGEGKSDEKGLFDDPENSNLAFLHDEPDSLIRKGIFQFIEGHELLEVISPLKLQLLNANVRLAHAHETRLSPRT